MGVNLKVIKGMFMTFVLVIYILWVFWIYILIVVGFGQKKEAIKFTGFFVPYII